MEPRSETGLKMLYQGCPDDIAKQWEPCLVDESRRSFAGYLPCPFDEATRTKWFETLKENVDWLQPEGSHGPIPRKTAWMTGPGCTCEYKYGGIQVPPLEYPPWFVEIMKCVMPYCGLTDKASWPTSCNMNLYTDGGMSVGWHSDDEALFQGKFRDIQIISLSLGVARKFEMRKNWPEEKEKAVTVKLLKSGDLMTMEGMLQKHYQHRVPKENHVEGPRINLTWRWVVKHGPKCPQQRSRGKDGGKGKRQDGCKGGKGKRERDDGYQNSKGKRQKTDGDGQDCNQRDGNENGSDKAASLPSLPKDDGSKGKHVGKDGGKGKDSGKGNDDGKDGDGKGKDTGQNCGKDRGKGKDAGKRKDSGKDVHDSPIAALAPKCRGAIAASASPVPNTSPSPIPPWSSDPPGLNPSPAPPWRQSDDAWEDSYS